nr:hypothetical protein [Aminivibrio sp.]
MPGPVGYEKLTAFRDRISFSAAAAGIIALFGFLIYSNTFQNQFLFDDLRNIRDNPSIRDLKLFLDPQVIFKPRGLVNLTFALNYAAGGIHVFGYHLVNTVIHILNGIVVFFLSRLLFSAARQKSINGRPSGDGEVLWMSFFAALFFLAHPVQTQAVTYIVQRYASMAALFYLLACLFYVKGRMARQSGPEVKRKRPASPGKGGPVFGRGLPFFALAALCAPLAYLCKQNAASLPAALLLIEVLFLRGKKRFRAGDLLVPAVVAVLWALFILAVQLVGTGSLFSPDLLEDVSRMTVET